MAVAVATNCPANPGVVVQVPAHDDRQEQDREDGPDEIGPPAAPADLRPDEAEEDAADGRPGQEVREVADAHDRRDIVDGPGHHDTHEQDQPQAEPALGRSVDDAADHRASTSPSAFPGVMT